MAIISASGASGWASTLYSTAPKPPGGGANRGFELAPAQGTAAGAGLQEAAHKPDSAAAEFKNYMAMSPAEKIRYSMLERMGLTEDDLKAMPPEERDKIEMAIARKIQEELEKSLDTATARQSPVGQAVSVFQTIQANAENRRHLDTFS